MNNEPLGRYLRSMLAERGWSQNDLVRASGVDKTTMSGLFTGKTKPRPATLGRIEAALGLDMGTLALVATGNDKEQADHTSLQEASDAELIAELTWRLENKTRQLQRARKAVEGQAEQVPAGSPVVDLSWPREGFALAAMDTDYDEESEANTEEA